MTTPKRPPEDLGGPGPGGVLAPVQPDARLPRLPAARGGRARAARGCASPTGARSSTRSPAGGARRSVTVTRACRRRCASSRRRSSTSSPPTPPARRWCGSASGCWRRRTVCRRTPGEPAAPPGRAARPLRQGVPGRQRLDRRRDRAEDGAAGAGAARGRRGARASSALENGYHGETVGALSVGDLELYAAPYRSLCFPVQRLRGLPYRARPARSRAGSTPAPSGRRSSAALDAEADTLAAIIYEPVLQAAGGMLLFSPDLLRRLRAWADAHGVYLIADEIAAGMGRLGAILASHLADGPGRVSTAALPDFAVLSKGLTGGVLPLSAVLTTDAIYALLRRRLRRGARLPALEHLHRQRARRRGRQRGARRVRRRRSAGARGGARAAAARGAGGGRRRAPLPAQPCAPAGWWRRSTFAARDGGRWIPRRRTGYARLPRGGPAGRAAAAARRHDVPLPAAHRRPTAEIDEMAAILGDSVDAVVR